MELAKADSTSTVTITLHALDSYFILLCQAPLGRR